MSGPLHILDGVKDGSISLRVSPQTRRNLAALADLLNTTQTAAIEEAITHLLGTLLRDQPVFRTLPGDGLRRPA